MRKLSKNALIYGFRFCTGGVAYGGLEILWRGCTHISMLLLGGLCFCFLNYIAGIKLNFYLKCLLGSLFISSGELLTGCIVNLWLNLNVWDYSGELCQLGGQICIRYSLLWYLLSALVIPVCRRERQIVAWFLQLYLSVSSLLTQRWAARRNP